MSSQSHISILLNQMMKTNSLLLKLLSKLTNLEDSHKDLNSRFHKDHNNRIHKQNLNNLAVLKTILEKTLNLHCHALSVRILNQNLPNNLLKHYLSHSTTMASTSVNATHANKSHRRLSRWNRPSTTFSTTILVICTLMAIPHMWLDPPSLTAMKVVRW